MRTRILAGALALLLVPAAARSADRLTVDPAIDVPVTLAAGVYYLALVSGPDRQPLAVPQNLPPPTGIDALAVLELRPGYARASDLLLSGILAGTVIWDVADGWRDGSPLGRSLLFLEAALLVGAVNETAKWAVRRPRPYTFSERSGPDDDLSFFSGHASFASMATFTLARSLDLTGELEAWERIGLYGGAGLLSAAVASLRVLAGKHYPSDVLVGLAFGGAVGWLVPELHRHDGLAVTPMPVAGGGAGLLVTSRF